MPTGNEGFAVHLQSLTDFAGELATQLSGMGQPLSDLDSLVEHKLRLGEFNEAYALWNSHGIAVSEMYILVGQARDAIEFANEITKTVSVAYQTYDDTVTGAMHAVGKSIQEA
ncbi:MAG TPA: hypothetical protein VFV67_32175 [Actinophytocola sp.]|uniref:hypothetical protein n=1 Tax=Actinophytocola sp. TaxID=1872138 RepID=UPI002DBDCEBD|nr:hypothetical protein [Actinophytocola sp.]HEU5475324.1 hypothetical protein [Actinophytocola sp.]